MERGRQFSPGASTGTGGKADEQVRSLFWPIARLEFGGRTGLLYFLYADSNIEMLNPVPMLELGESGE